MKHLEENFYIRNNYMFSIIKILSVKYPYTVHSCEAFGCFCHESVNIKKIRKYPILKRLEK